MSRPDDIGCSESNLQQTSKPRRFVYLSYKPELVGTIIKECVHGKEAPSNTERASPEGKEVERIEDGDRGKYMGISRASRSLICFRSLGKPSFHRD